MTDIRLLEPTEYRAAATMFSQTLLQPAPTDEQWEQVQHSYQPKRAFGAFDGDQVVGLARSCDTRLTVPGGAQVSMSAVTGVGVRSSHTRRGVMTALKRAQFEEFVARGVTVAALHASEGSIYGRFGYGVGTQARRIRVHRRRAQLHDAAPTGGEIVLHDIDEGIERIRDMYAACGPSRTGMIERPPQLWGWWERRFRKADGAVRVAEFRDDDGVTRGYAAYNAYDPWPDEGVATLRLFDMVTTTPASLAGLWRYLLSVDLITRIESWARPVDEPLEALFTDQRAVETTAVDDDVWLRLIDVPAALEARSYGHAEPVVLDVDDAFLPANAGRYRVTTDGASRTDSEPDVRLTVGTLAMIYLGGWRPSALAEAGLITGGSPAVLEALDHLFATNRAPWCGTFF